MRAYVHFSAASSPLQLQAAHKLYGPLAEGYFAAHKMSLLWIKSFAAPIEYPCVVFCHDGIHPGKHLALSSQGAHVVGKHMQCSRPILLELCEASELPVVPWIRCGPGVEDFRSKTGRVVVKRSGTCNKAGVQILEPNEVLEEMSPNALCMAWVEDPMIYKLYMFNGVVLAGHSYRDSIVNKGWHPPIQRFVPDNATHELACRLSRRLTLDCGWFMVGIDMMMFQGRLHVVEMNPSALGIRGLADWPRFRCNTWNAMMAYMKSIR